MIYRKYNFEFLRIISDRKDKLKNLLDCSFDSKDFFFTNTYYNIDSVTNTFCDVYVSFFDKEKADIFRILVSGL